MTDPRPNPADGHEDVAGQANRLRSEMPRSRSVGGFIGGSHWSRGSRTAAWDELWFRILSSVRTGEESDVIEDEAA